MIVNADDMGLHLHIDQGILRCIDKKRVNSVSIVSSGQAVNWSLILDLSKQGVFTGLHVCLVGEPWQTQDIFFANYWDFLLAWIKKPIRLCKLVENEIDYQLKTYLDHGIPLDHIDSHQHVHMLPFVFNIIQSKAIELNVQRVRISAINKWSAVRHHPMSICLELLSKYRFRHCSQMSFQTLFCRGIQKSGHYGVEDIRNELLTCHESIEWVAHPGVSTSDLMATYPWGYDWTGEMNAYLSDAFLEIVAQNGFSIRFRDTFK